MSKKTTYEHKLGIVKRHLVEHGETLLDDDGVDEDAAETLAAGILEDLGITPRQKRLAAYISPGHFVKGRGHLVCFVTENEAGFSETGGQGRAPWYWGDPDNERKSYKLAQETANEFNARLGLTPDDVNDIIVSSMRLGPVH